MTASFEPRWYVVQTQTHSENKAAAHLARQAFEVYLPRHLKRRHHARRTETVARPLFPRYLFVRIDIGMQRWRSIHSTVGVVRLICQGENPLPVPAQVIDDLKGGEDERGFIVLDERPKFTPGDRVRILDGAFDSHLGLYESMTDGERVAVLLDLLGRKVRVSLDADLITAA